MPHDDTNRSEWESGLLVTEVFRNWGAGVLTARNGLAVSDDREELMARIRRFADLSVPDSVLESEYEFASNYQWKTGKARREFASGPVEDLAVPYTFRPFDFRWIYWHTNVVWNMRGDKMEVFRHEPAVRGLMFSRNTRHPTYTNVYVTSRIADRHCLEEANVAPLYETAGASGGLFGAGGLVSNLSAGMRDALSKSIGLAPLDEGHGDLRANWGPEDAFDYLYAVLHSPTYRHRYSEFLKIDFPRIPLPASVELFRTLGHLGAELAGLHLLESPHLGHLVTTYSGPARPEVGRVGWSEDTVWLDAPLVKKGQPAKPGSIGFRGVTEAVWNFHVGGYQVCDKWLKDRKGRRLSEEDVVHYQQMIVGLVETIRLMAEIDDVIESNGGWPSAFQTGESV
jgi:hypothetical protein